MKRASEIFKEVRGCAQITIKFVECGSVDRAKASQIGKSNVKFFINHLSTVCKGEIILGNWMAKKNCALAENTDRLSYLWLARSFGKHGPMKTRSMKSLEQVTVTSRQEWRNWLDQNYLQTESIWLVTYKKHMGDRYVSYDTIADHSLIQRRFIGSRLAR